MSQYVFRLCIPHRVSGFITQAIGECFKRWECIFLQHGCTRYVVVRVVALAATQHTQYALQISRIRRCVGLRQSVSAVADIELEYFHCVHTLLAL